MELKKLENSFYIENPVVHQALDFNSLKKEWNSQKVRGHGIVKIEIMNLIFAIPVRSNIKHRASFILEVNRADKRVKGMGLDYSKALLITDPQYISNDVFLLRSKEAGKKLQDKEEHITKQFSRYVEKYISAVKKRDNNILQSYEYRFTTLVNYHQELGL